MSNEKEINSDLLRYLEDTSLEEISEDSPYNETDALVFSTLAYCQLEDVKDLDCATVSEYLKKYSTIKNGQYNEWETSDDKVDKERVKFIELIMNNPRYKDLKIVNPEGEVNTGKPEQFGAMTIILPNNDGVVAYRGTNGTAEGWYEDILFGTDLDGTYAQHRAVEYLENASKYVNNIHLAGHSKAGYEVEWAGVFCSEVIKQRIISMTSFDGPSFNSKVLNIGDNRKKYEELQEQLGDNWVKILPQDSIIGRVLEDFANIKVATSDEFLIMQHDTFSWKFNEDGRLETGEITTTPLSDYLNDVLDDAIAMIPSDDLEMLTHVGFLTFINAQNGKLDDILLGDINEIIETAKDNPLRAKHMIDARFNAGTKLVDTAKESLFTIAGCCAVEAQRRQIENMIRKVNELRKNIVEKVEKFKESIKSASDNVTEYIHNGINELEESIKEGYSQMESFILSEVCDNNLERCLYYYLKGKAKEKGESTLETISIINDAMMAGVNAIKEKVEEFEEAKDEIINKVENKVEDIAKEKIADLKDFCVARLNEIRGNVETISKAASISHTFYLSTSELMVDIAVASMRNKVENLVIGASLVSGLSIALTYEINKQVDAFANKLEQVKEWNIEGAKNLLRRVNKYKDMAISRINNLFPLDGVLTKASEFKYSNVNYLNSCGKVGLEFALIPRIDAKIDEIVYDYNKTIDGDLASITSLLSKLRFTSLGISGYVSSCENCLVKQKNSLHDFRDELKEYESVAKRMEADIIKSFAVIESF